MPSNWSVTSPDSMTGARDASSASDRRTGEGDALPPGSKVAFAPHWGSRDASHRHHGDVIIELRPAGEPDDPPHRSLRARGAARHLRGSAQGIEGAVEQVE